MDEYTADAWHDVLAAEPWLALETARQAAVAIKRRQPFIDVSEVIAEAKRIRRAELDAIESDRYRQQAIEQAERQRQLVAIDRAKLEDPESIHDLIEDVRRQLADARERYRAQTT